MDTVAELVRRRAEDPNPGLLFEDGQWTWAECVHEMGRRAAWIAGHRGADGDRPVNLGLLLENTPEYHFWLGAAALAGATIVGLNPTRTGESLRRDIDHTDCVAVIVEEATRPLVDGLDLAVPVLDAGSLVLPEDGAVPHRPGVDGSTRLLLLFTSGTTAAPRAVICSQGRLAGISVRAAESFRLEPADVAYGSMPMFHSNALMACWGPVLAAGATLALRRRFSASGFLPDVRRFGATYANYVGKPLAYVLATPEQPDDADNPLRLVFGNEGTHGDVERFGARFGCTVIDGYGSTEGVIALRRPPGLPPGALGHVGPDGEPSMRDPETGAPCAVARFDGGGRLLNAAEAVGEITSRATGGFEGYYRNDEADAQRVRDGRYWSGDLGYVDAEGVVYFAGRTAGWLRVDGENLAVAPVERVLSRHPDVSLVAVYGVPNEIVGDDVMAALQLAPGARFDPDGFAAFLAAQTDLGAKAEPRYLRVTAVLPVSATNKVRTRDLQAVAWDRVAGDEIWWRPERGAPYRRLGDEDRRRIGAQVVLPHSVRP
jgi:fatty-acyl-CoA synthase